MQKDPGLWKNAYENRLRGLDWVVEEALKNAPRPLPPETKKALAKELIQWLTFVSDPTEQADWFLRLAAKLETNEQNLRELFRRIKPNAPLAASREQVSTNQTTQEPSLHSLVDTSIAILLTFPETYPVLKTQFSGPAIVSHNPLFAKLIPLIQNIPTDSSLEQNIESHLSDDERKEVALQSEGLLVQYGDIELSPSWAITELSLILQRIRTESRDQAKSAISEEIQRAQQLGDVEKIKSLFQELQNLIY